MRREKIKERLDKLATIVEKEFKEILTRRPVMTETFLRLYLIDNSFIDIRYPKEDKYSFHWQKGRDSVRINTAPHHPEIPSFPRHIHTKEEISADEITDINFSPQENLRRFLEYVKSKIEHK